MRSFNTDVCIYKWDVQTKDWQLDQKTRAGIKPTTKEGFYILTLPCAIQSNDGSKIKIGASWYRVFGETIEPLKTRTKALIVKLSIH